MNLKEYINLPYKNIGRDKSGVDCYGLVKVIYEDKLNINLPDFTELLYDKDWYKTQNHIIDNIWEDWVEVTQPYKIWDALLFYSFELKTIVNHIGIMIDEGKFLHISSKYPSRVDRLTDYWESRLYKVLRHKRMIPNG
jgi:cell wall-associated NlpC family hydrolase